MKIVCDNCATKYSIADEKVRGKVFKIRCKKCSHIIVVRGTEGEAGAEGAGDPNYADGENATVASSSAPAGGSGDSVWHLVIDREQVGPMTPAEVRAKVAAGQADAETYAWREGFGDWLRLASIDEFRDVGKAAPEARTMLGSDMPPEVAAAAAAQGDSTRRSDPNDLFAQAAASQEDDGGASDLFGGAKGGSAPASASFAQAASTGEDLFGSSGPTAASPAPAALFSAPAAEAPRGRSNAMADHGGGGGGASPAEAKMTGQRNENSVLFSLNNLQALATGGGGGGSKSNEPAARPGYASAKNEGSGLIDIRAMAAQTLSAPGSSSNDSADLPAFNAAPVFSPVVAAPIMMPQQSTGMPKWVWGVLGGGILLVGGMVAVLVIFVTKKPEMPTNAQLIAFQAAQNPGTPGAPAPPPGALQPAAPGAPVAAVAKPEGAAPGVAAADPGEKKGKTAKVAGAPGAKHDKASGTKKEDAPSAAAAPSAPPPAKEKPKKGGDTSLDDLLDGATPKSAPRAAAPAAHAAVEDDPNLPDQLGRGDIVAGMGSIKGKVDGCFAQYKVPGTAMVAVVIAKTGKVQSATVGGALSGTPTGDCVSRAVKSAAFKKFKGGAMSISYPFILR